VCLIGVHVNRVPGCAPFDPDFDPHLVCKRIVCVGVRGCVPVRETCGGLHGYWGAVCTRTRVRTPFHRLGVNWSNDRQNRCRNIGASEITDEIAGRTPYFGD
jgi:hypothetical protein